MSRHANNERRLVITILFAVLVAGVSLLAEMSASSSSSAATQTSPQRSNRPTTQRKSSTQATPTPSPTGLGSMGPPPPVPKLKPTPEPEINPGEVISVETTEVMLPVTVRDFNGKLVSNLTQKDFRVFEDDNEQRLSDLALRQVPVDAVLMVDASSSVASNLDDFRRAAEGFAQRLQTEDRISLIKFDDRIELLQDWTNSRFQLRRALNRIEPGMFTRFNDALLLAAKEQFSPGKTRHAVIVLSDGIDSGRGAATLEGALQALLKAQVTVYVVSNTQIARASKKAELDTLLRGSDSAQRFNQLRIEDLREGLRVLDVSENNLDQIAKATGGRLYTPQSFEDLTAVYAEVADELRHQYAVYYTPLNKTRDGGFRRVHVRMSNGSYSAATRVGYFAPKS
jgi:VWFA-related protein